MLKVAPLMLLLLAAGAALGDRDLSQYTPGRPVHNTYPGIMPLGAQSHGRPNHHGHRHSRSAEENHHQTRPVPKPVHTPFISPTPPAGKQPVRTLPALVSETRTGELPPKHTLTRPVPRPTRPRVSPVPPKVPVETLPGNVPLQTLPGNVPVQTLPATLPETRTGELPPKDTLTRPVPRPTRPRVSPVPPKVPAQTLPGNIPLQTLPGKVPVETLPGELPPKHTLTRPFVRPPRPQN